MTAEPRSESDYSQRQTEAAHRVLIDIGQVLASFTDCMVLVGGWVPDLLLADVEPPHVGSIDVDIALDAEKLNDGSYAELIQHKPKDTYDLCYCLDYHSDNMETLAEKWKQRLDDKKIVKAVQILREKFDSVNAFGPRQLVEFHNAADDETRAMHAQRALQLVQKFLSLL